MRALRSKLTYANVISTLCLFMLLGGGAYAATQLPKNSVGSKQIKNNAITGQKIKKGSIDTSKLTASAVATLKGAQGERGAVGPQGPQGLTNSGAYATVVAEFPPVFLGSHPGFTAVERFPDGGDEELLGIYCLTPSPGTSIAHPIASADWADSVREGVFVEPLAAESFFSKCDEGELEVHTYGLFEAEPGIPVATNDVSFTVFVPAPQ
jgi:hypothetical protein